MRVLRMYNTHHKRTGLEVEVIHESPGVCSPVGTVHHSRWRHWCAVAALSARHHRLWLGICSCDHAEHLLVFCRAWLLTQTVPSGFVQRISVNTTGQAAFDTGDSMWRQQHNVRHTPVLMLDWFYDTSHVTTIMSQHSHCINQFTSVMLQKSHYNITGNNNKPLLPFSTCTTC